MLGASVPILRSFDEARARAFYLDFLGFELVFEHRFKAGMPLYLGVRHGDCVLHLSEHYGDGAPGAAIRISVDDVAAFAAFAAALRAKGFENARPGEPQPTRWGTREFALHDPAHNHLTFFSPLAEPNNDAAA